MDETEAQRQITQMVAFILQEAREKQRELELRTQHDFELDRQTRVHKGKLRIDEEFVRKEKDLEVKKRIAYSQAVADQMTIKMKHRDDLLNQLLDDARTRLAEFSKSQDKYKTFIKQLIVQGLVKLDEKKVIIRTRECDVDLVKGVLGEALEQYKNTMEKDAGREVSLDVSVNEKAKKHLPPPPSAGHVGPTCAGGIILIAHKGKIICDNTLDARLELVFEECKPVVRRMTFPSQTKLTASERERAAAAEAGSQ